MVSYDVIATDAALHQMTDVGCHLPYINISTKYCDFKGGSQYGKMNKTKIYKKL